MRKPISMLYKYEGRGRGDHTLYTPPHESLATAASRPNNEALAARVVLAHPCATFHHYTCGLCGGAAGVDAVLISYDHMKVAAETSTRRRRS
jgi:hypothetical protein